jgi:NAD+ diphosphatase
MITIFEAAAEGDLDFLKKNVRILTEKNERGWTVLHFAARFGQLPIAQYLKQEAKLDLTVTNGEGKTASEVASFWGYDDIAKLLAPPVVEKEVPQGAYTFPDNYTAVFAGNPLNRQVLRLIKKKKKS